VRVTSKGQVTIPQEIRNRLGLLPHTRVEFELAGNHARIRKARRPRGESARARLTLVPRAIAAIFRRLRSSLPGKAGRCDWPFVTRCVQRFDPKGVQSRRTASAPNATALGPDRNFRVGGSAPLPWPDGCRRQDDLAAQDSEG
jgi:AbrB family looped-hinge helix DNA binding protein